MASKVTTKSVKPKAAAKTVKKVAKVAPKATKAVKAEPKIAKPTEKVASSLTVAVFDNKGVEKGSVKLPEAVFGAKINKTLMSQAVRVYLANQRMGAAVSKTRGEVEGSTRKIYRQKGTGRARHGGIRAPIFVGGGTAHGPKSKDYSLTMPQQMKKAALLSALTSLAKDGAVKVVAGLADLEPKTKLTAKVFAGMGLTGKKALLVLPSHLEKVFKGARNLKRVNVASVSLLTTYDVMNAGTLVVMQDALAVFEKQFASKPVRQAQGKKESK